LLKEDELGAYFRGAYLERHYGPHVIEVALYVVLSWHQLYPDHLQVT